MRLHRRIFQLLGALPELLGLHRQQVAAGVDADVVELGGLLAQLLGDLHVALELARGRGVQFVESLPGARIGEREHRRFFRAQQRVEQYLELADLGEVEVVGRLVEQKHVRIGDPDAGDQRQPLPAAAQGSHRPLAHLLGHAERVENHVDTPDLAVDLLGRQGIGDDLMEAAVEQRVGDGLFDMADAQAARPGDVTGGGFDLARQASEQRGFAAAIGGNDSEPVAGDDAEVKVGKERRTHGDAEGFEADQSHVHFSGLPGGTPVDTL